MTRQNGFWALGGLYSVGRSLWAAVATILVSATFMASAQPANAQSMLMQCIPGSPQVVRVGETFGNIHVLIYSTSNAAGVAGTPVTFTGPATGAGIDPIQVRRITDSNGRVDFAPTANATPGAFTLTIDGDGAAVQPGYDCSPNFVIQSAPPAEILVEAGSGQAAPINASFSEPLTARVVDSGGNPVQGVTLTFNEPHPGPSVILSSRTAVTGADGQARVTVRANGEAGSYSVFAVAPGLASVGFALTNFGPPEVGATTTSVDAGSADSPVNLDVRGLNIESVAVATHPANGIAAVSASGTEITYSPASGFFGTDSFTYTATNPAGTSAPARATIIVAPPPPAVSSVSVPANGYYGVGANLFFTVTFDAPVVLDSSGGTASVPVTVGSTLRQAGYVSGSGSNSLVFRYTVAEGDLDLSGIHLGSGIALNGGSIRSAAGTDALLSLQNIAPTSNIFVDGVAPSVLSTGIVGDPVPSARSGTFGIIFSEPVTGLTLSDLALTTTGTAAGSVTALQTADNISYTAQVGSVSGSGTLRLDVIADAVQDRAGNRNAAFTSGSLWSVAPATIDVSPAASALPRATGGSAYDQSFTASGGTAPYGFSISVGDLPPGLSLAADGALTGIPTEAGSFTFTVTATDDNGYTGAGTYTLDVDAPAITVSPPNLAAGIAGVIYGPVPYSADGGTAPYSFTLTGDLPDGVRFDGSELSGTPTENGGFAFTITVVDALGFTASRSYTLVIDAPGIALDPASLADGVAGEEYGPLQFVANGGSAPYSFTASGDLPDGLGFVNGVLSGTPREAGSFAFTVTATDALHFTGNRSYTLTIDPPDIFIDAPELPIVRVGNSFPAVTFSARGGIAPYSFSMAGNLPEGMTFSTGVLSGTPLEAGHFDLPVTVTDSADFTASRTVRLTVEAAELPEANDHVLEVMAGTTGTVELTAGATGGPFTGAVILAAPDREAGVPLIAGGSGRYMLHFAAAGSFAGTTSLTYRLSNADGTSLPATVTITVVARPDPSLDPEVIGLIRAQTETAKRLANAQITNFNQRLEQLHDEGERRRTSMNLSVGTTHGDAARTAYGQEIETDPTVEAFRRMDGGWQPASNPVANLLGDLAIWSGGYVNFGTKDDGAINLDHTLVGVSGGVDYRFTPQFTAGFGIGYGRDVTDVDFNGTETRAEAFSLAAYGSYRPVPGFFLDGVAGYSTMSFDSRRYVTESGDFAGGSRSGDQLFASLTAGYEYRNDGLLISPYGRLSGSRSTLDAFAETGAGMRNLTYGQQSIDALSSMLGLRFAYSIPTTRGTLTPRGRVEYTHDFEGSSRARLGYGDLGTLPYILNIQGLSRDHLALGLGLDARIGEDWDIGFDYSTTFATNGNSQDHRFTARLAIRF